MLAEELVFRGGTCSSCGSTNRGAEGEDLDYVRRSAGGVGDVLDALREVAEAVGFDRVLMTIGSAFEGEIRFDLRERREAADQGRDEQDMDPVSHERWTLWAARLMNG